MKRFLVLLISFVFVGISLCAQVVPAEVYSGYGSIRDKYGNKLSTEQLQELTQYGFDLARYERLHKKYVIEAVFPFVGLGMIGVGAYLPETKKSAQKALYSTGGVVLGTSCLLCFIHDLAIEKMTYNLRTSAGKNDGAKELSFRIGGTDSGIGVAFVF